MDTIQINRMNYFDQLNLTFQICSAMLHNENATIGEHAIANALIRLLDIEITTYSRAGLPSERDYWQSLKKQMQKILKE